MTGHAGVAARPAYTLSKLAGTLVFQVVAQNVSPKELQIVSFHPGLIYNDAWKATGLPQELFDGGKKSAPTKSHKLTSHKTIFAARLPSGLPRRKLNFSTGALSGRPGMSSSSLLVKSGSESRRIPTT
jgi:NAD(P)-dependent dehydrogenase (short-subunit alcohol dehydrogenase family)